MLSSSLVKPCIVSFADPDGLRHVADVQAELLYEAAAIAVRAFRLNDCASGPLSQLEVEIREPAVKHVVTLQKLESYVDSASKSPKETLAKKRLREFLTA